MILKRLMSWLNEEATARRKDLLVPYLVLAFAVSGGFVLDRRQDNDRTASVRRDQLAAEQDLARFVYATDLAEYQNCLVRIDTLAAQKSSSDGIYDSLAALSERFGAPDLAQAVREEKGRFDAEYKVPDVSSCVKPDAPDAITP